MNKKTLLDRSEACKKLEFFEFACKNSIVPTLFINEKFKIICANKTACENCTPVFEGFARANYYLGEFGMGTKMKFVANLLVTIHNVSAAEAFVLGMKAGLDPEMILKVISDGAGTSRMFEVRGPLMATGKYDEPTMKVDVFQKDIKIISSFANELQCPTPLLSAAAKIYTAALADGRAKQDTASVCAVLEKMAGLKRGD